MVKSIDQSFLYLIGRWSIILTDQHEHTINPENENGTAWIQSYIHSPEKLRKLYKRTLIIIVISQIFGGAGLAAGVAVGALLAQELLGTDSFAGVPTALYTLGSAGAALLIGLLSQRFGRRLGLATGFFVGGLGAIGVVMAALFQHIPLLFISLLIYGVGSATNLQVRYAGTDLARPTQRATAISVAMVSTTLGAVAGPNLIDVMGKFATLLNLPALAGPFILSSVAFNLAGLILVLFLRPDPLLVANAITVEAEKGNKNPLLDHDTNTFEKNDKGVLIGATIMVLTQIIMVAIMTMTPIHMKHHGHDLGEIGLIISIHIGAMYLPSLFTGVLVDRIGRTAIACASATTLLVAGILAAVAPVDSMLVLMIALGLLGLGWNFGLISGTALIVDATHPTVRAKIQGRIDVLIALTGASSGAISGMVVAHSSYATLSILGSSLSLILIPILIWSRNNRRKK